MYLKPLDQKNAGIDLPSGVTSLGRGPLLDCTDKKVSRQHAQIELSASGDVILTSVSFPNRP